MRTCPTMQRIITQIAAKHEMNLADVGAYVCLDMPGFDRLCIGVLTSNCIGVSHTYEILGARIPEPRVDFVVRANNWFPVSIRQSFGAQQIYVLVSDFEDHIRCINPRGQADLASFCETWARNIIDQGWLEQGVQNQAASTRRLTLPEGRKPRFTLGQVVATPGALEALERAGETADVYLGRHVTTDWGDLDEQDRQANAQALLYGGRLFSAYTLKDGTRLWLITEADRSVSTLLLPIEY